MKVIMLADTIVSMIDGCGHNYVPSLNDYGRQFILLSPWPSPVAVVTLARCRTGARTSLLTGDLEISQLLVQHQYGRGRAVAFVSGRSHRTVSSLEDLCKTTIAHGFLNGLALSGFPCSP